MCLCATVLTPLAPQSCPAQLARNEHPPKTVYAETESMMQHAITPKLLCVVCGIQCSACRAACGKRSHAIIHPTSDIISMSHSCQTSFDLRQVTSFTCHASRLHALTGKASLTLETLKSTAGILLGSRLHACSRPMVGLTMQQLPKVAGCAEWLDNTLQGMYGDVCRLMQTHHSRLQQ